MPIYEYGCEACGNVFEKIQKVADRRHARCECGQTADQRVTAANFDPRMGCDPDFPTFASKWMRKQKDKASGKMRDSNNSQLTSTDTDRIKFDKRGS